MERALFSQKLVKLGVMSATGAAHWTFEKCDRVALVPDGANLEYRKAQRGLDGIVVPPQLGVGELIVSSVCFFNADVDGFVLSVKKSLPVVGR